MFIHIEFKDGSNPYVRYTEAGETVEALYKDLKRWKKNFYLTPIPIAWSRGTTRRGLFFLAENKWDRVLSEG